MNLYEYFRRNVRARPDSPAIERPDATDITYEDLDRDAKQVAAWLDDRNAETVGIVMLNHPSYLAIVLGAWRAGAVVTPVNVRFGTEEVRQVFEDVEPDVVFAGAALINRAKEAADDTMVHQIGEEIDDLADPETAPKVTRFDDEPAVQMHTSGTTGDPKPVRQTHRTISAQADIARALYEVDPSDTNVVSVPLFHVGGLHIGTLISIFSGASVALQSFWNADGWARLVEETEATFSGLIPAMMTDVLETESAREYDTSSLDLVFSGGSPATEAQLQEFEEAFEIDNLLQLYGQTECCGVTVTYEADETRRPGAIGKPIPIVETKLADPETGETVKGRGELLLRGDSVATYAKESLNEEAFTDGWFHSGDVVEVDDEGYLHYVDRVDDIILSGGEKVSPAGVEDVLYEMDGVTEAAVLGTPHERWGEAVTAAIVAEDESLTEDDVMDFCDQREDLANYKKPRRVVFVEELPRTATQKVDKVELSEDLPEFE